MAGQPLSGSDLANLRNFLSIKNRPGSEPVTQQSIDSLSKGASEIPLEVPPMNPVANILAPTATSMPKITKEVTTTTTPDGKKIEKAKHTEEPLKPVNAAPTNGDLIPAGAAGAPGLAPAEESKSNTISTRTSRMANLPPADVAAFELLKNQRLDQIAANEAASRDFITSYQPRTDMSSLLSFFGSQLGRDYLKGYQKPSGLNELVGMQDKLEENIAKAKTGLSDTEMQYLKARMGLQDTTSKSETTADKLLNLELLKQKNAGTGLGDEKFKDQLKRDEKAAKKEYMTTKEFGKTLDAHDKIFQASANINKVLYARGGTAPLPGTEDAKQFAQAAAELIYLVNQYDADLGALAAADSEYLKKSLGFTGEAAGEYLQSVYSPAGLMEAVQRFQDKMKAKSLERLKDVRDVYSDYPSVLKMIDSTEKRVLPAIQDMEASRTGKGKGQSRSKSSIDEAYDKLTPEQKLEVDKIEKGGG